VPAIQRYDGVNYRVLRKAIRESRCPCNLDILILSSKYGLISAATPIPTYDAVMTRRRALELRGAVSSAMEAWATDKSYSEVFVNAGRTYRLALDMALLECRTHSVRIAEGGIGVKMAAMKAWMAAASRRGQRSGGGL